jgi:hypothetical protein
MVIAGAAAVAQDQPSQFAFEAFPATETFTGRSAAPDFATLPEVRPFAGHVQTGLRRGINFAGAYTIVSWPCRSQCVSLLVVGARDGRLYTAPEAFNGLRFRRDSRLLIVSPPENVPAEVRGNPPPEMRTEYWEFVPGTGFRRLDDPAIGARPGPAVVFYRTGWGSGRFGEALGTSEPPPPGRQPGRNSQQRAPAR